MRTSTLLCAGLAATGTQAYTWMQGLSEHDIASVKARSAGLDKRAATCPVHLIRQGAAPYSDTYPSKYTGAKLGLPGTGKGGVLVPAAGDTAHAYNAPSSSDIRGPCPALNLAANHNFISHDGLTNFVELVDMAQNVFNWGWDLAVFVATFGIVMDGDPLTSSLSIGCAGGQPVPNTGLNTHDKFEGDSSMARTDFFLSPTGNAYDVNATLFGDMANFCNGVMDLNCMGPYMRRRYDDSLHTNGNFFASPLFFFNLGTAVLPQESFASLGNQGTPDADTMAYFWAVEKTAGPAPNYKYVAHPGTERLPPNWYNRPTPLSFPKILAEVFGLYAAGGSPPLGGNTGRPDSFNALDLPGFVEGGKLINATPDGVACLLYQAVTDVLPLSVSNILTQNPVAKAFAQSKLGDIMGQFGCPNL